MLCMPHATSAWSMPQGGGAVAGTAPPQPREVVPTLRTTHCILTPASYLYTHVLSHFITFRHIASQFVRTSPRTTLTPVHVASTPSKTPYNSLKTPIPFHTAASTTGHGSAPATAAAPSPDKVYDARSVLQDLLGDLYVDTSRLTTLSVLGEVRARTCVWSLCSTHALDMHYACIRQAVCMH